MILYALVDNYDRQLMPGLQIIHLENLGDSQTEDDRDAIRSLRGCLESHKRTGEGRGTLLTMLAAMAAERHEG